jgi:hypothetical protein
MLAGEPPLSLVHKARAGELLKQHVLLDEMSNLRRFPKMKRYAALLAIAMIAFPVVVSAGANFDAALLGGVGPVATKTNCTSLLKSTCAAINPNGSYVGLNCSIGTYVGRIGGLSLTAVDFGIIHNLYINSWTTCSDLEAPAVGWPASGGGNTVVWGSCQIASEVILVGWFSAYVYANGFMDLTIHPTYGVARVLDCLSNFDGLKVPAHVDPAGRQTGHNPPCDVVAVQKTTWGNVKSLYQN